MTTPANFKKAIWAGPDDMILQHKTVYNRNRNCHTNFFIPYLNQEYCVLMGV